jgi:hypothetical protein
MPTALKVVGAIVAFMAVLIGTSIFASNWNARRPKDMPNSSVWLDAPHVPFGFNRGWWVGCWTDVDGRSNRCRMWDPNSHSVTFEGRYVPCSVAAPVPASELPLKASPTGFSGWVFDAQGNMAPAIFLKDGRVLVPIDAKHSCEKLPAEE